MIKTRKLPNSYSCKYGEGFLVGSSLYELLTKDFDPQGSLAKLDNEDVTTCRREKHNKISHISVEANEITTQFLFVNGC